MSGSSVAVSAVNGSPQLGVHHDRRVGDRIVTRSTVAMPQGWAGRASGVSARPGETALAGGLELGGIGWAIAEGESAPAARPVDPAWVTGLRDVSSAAVPFFFGAVGWVGAAHLRATVGEAARESACRRTGHSLRGSGGEAAEQLAE
jgi:hypothetical protein